MKSLSLRGFDEELERRLHSLAEREGISLNQAALRLMRKGAGLGESPKETNLIGSALDEFIGTWSEAEARDLTAAVEEFDTVDEKLWR